MTVVKGDTVFVKSNEFHHDELPGIVVSPGGNTADVLVLASGHNPFLMKDLKEIEYADDPVGFYELGKLYLNKDPFNADAPKEHLEGGSEESDVEGDGSGLVPSSEEESESQEENGEEESEEEQEKVDEPEADEEASADREDADTEDPVAKPKARASSRRKR